MKYKFKGYYSSIWPIRVMSEKEFNRRISEEDCRLERLAYGFFGSLGRKIKRTFYEFVGQKYEE